MMRVMKNVDYEKHHMVHQLLLDILKDHDPELGSWLYNHESSIIPALRLYKKSLDENLRRYARKVGRYIPET